MKLQRIMLGMKYFLPLLICIDLCCDADAIDCFKCISIGGDDRDCDDPFHNNGTLQYLESPCLGGRKGRDGLFPATACIKMAGIYDETGESLTVRSCALDSGTLTADSELIRMSHCGGFYYDDKYVRGCVQSCSDADACNESTKIRQLNVINLSIIVGLILVNYSIL